ncbi:hypothetical protein AB4559_18160 [Vibrio sp. 10N.222.51.C8]|jgi:hypothetical protein|uniref:Uncharacterized protein n=2 Tax=Vibrio cyclitrophicus TaxID=47951 RepID=A0A7Z1MLB2_9VIBR|nr:MULTISPECIES: hypothetical protein [Vibrio]PMP21900.1 hypothetical protein BCS91_19185 [Vibrio cyclitrophicus]PMP31546.1 hypothetical protein BCS90_11165 [Vibrio cyclitrophicus]TKG08587.1 hypothetical protein FCV67_08885 [Vibrio sp. F13]
MISWTNLDDGTHELKISDAFNIVLYPSAGYAIATGIDRKISLFGSTLEEQKQDVQRTVVAILLDIAEKVSPDDVRYGR